MKYQVVLFDADGVLITSKFRFSDLLKSEYGIGFDVLQPFFSGPFKKCHKGEADLKEELVKVVDDWGWKGTVDELMEFWFTKGTEIDQEMLARVEKLKTDGVRCFMATDQEKYRGENLTRRLGDGHPFEKVFISSSIGVPKKDPEFWEYVSREIGSIPKNEVLFIDDSIENIDAAKEFGFEGILFNSMDDLKRIV